MLDNNPANFSGTSRNSTNKLSPTVCIKNVGIPDSGNFMYFFIVGLIL